MKQRNTKTKIEIERLLRSSDLPLTLEHLWLKVKETFPATAHSTVYRTVKEYERQGRVRTIDWRERGNRYEWAEKPHHHHLVCEECSEVVDIDDRDLHYNDAALTKKTGFQIKHHSIELFGICHDCQKGQTA